MIRKYVERITTVLLVITVVALAVGQLLGQPVLIGYVSTGSMSPTLSAGDGFVAIPQPVGGDVNEGDVVVFTAAEIHGGGLVTHRVVETTDRGYVTKGDANSFTDQDGPEPIVSDDQIVATALQIDGRVVAIPHLGTIVAAVQSGGLTIQTSLFGSDSVEGTGGVGGLLVVVGTLVLGGSLVADRLGAPARRRERSRNRDGVVHMRTIAVVLLVIVLVAANAAMLGPAGNHTLELLSTEEPERDRYAVPVGETTSIDVPFHNDGIVPVLVILDGDDDRIEANDQFLIPAGAAREGTVSVTAPTVTRPFDGELVEHRYLGVLPPSVLGWLHARHPWLALLAVNLTLATGVCVTVRVGLGFGWIRLRTSDQSVATRLRRLLDAGR